MNKNNIEFKKIDQHLSLKASFDRQVIRIDDTVAIRVEFINHSNDVITFFPVSKTFLVRSSDYFPGNDPLLINLPIDLRRKIVLHPDENYILNYRLSVERPFFYIGENDSLYVSYHFNRKLIKKNIPPEILQGSLLSKPLVLEVK